MKIFKLGKNARKIKAKTLQIHDFLNLSVLPTPPAAFDWSMVKGKPLVYGMDGNDEYGCHDSKTEVLTDKGWCPWPDYDGHNLLGTMNRISGELEFQAPTSLIRYDYDGPMYYTEHKSLDFALTPNHRLWCRPYIVPKPFVPGSAGYGPCDFYTMDSLPTRLTMPATTTGFRGVGLKQIKIGDRVWDGDDFLAFLALVISDGWVDGPETKHTSPTISFCCFREDRREMVATLAHRLGIGELPKRRGVWNLYGDHALVAWIRANVYIGDTLRSPFKRIPDLVKVCEQQQISHFLEFFGDQHIEEHGRRAFFSSSQKLIDDMQELLLRVGKRGGICARDQRPTKLVPNCDGKDIALNEGERDRIGLNRISRLKQIQIDHYRGEVFCAEVPNSTLVTRRNGKLLISGNCCVFASGCHHIGTWTGNTSAEQIATEKDALDAYSLFTGFNPADPSTDQGANMLDVATRWRNTAIFGHKIAAFAAVDLKRLDLVAAAMYLFGGLWIGWALPKAWQGADSWTMSPGGILTGDWAPGSWGGHATHLPASSPKLLGAKTWAEDMPVEIPAFEAYAEEGYVLISEDTWDCLTGDECPAGVDGAALQAALAQVVV
jgi:hypothetical protein